MAPNRPKLRNFEVSDSARALDALVAAFEDDPAFLHLFPSLAGRRRALRWLQATAIRTARRNAGHVSITGDGTGVCIWYPEGTFPPPNTAYLSLLGALRHLPPSSIPRSLRALFLLQSKHPKGMPHLYVEVLGVNPAAQRGGHGSALLGNVCDRADAGDLPVYLETSKEANLAYYSRFGFEVIETVGIKNGPPYWLMLREAQGR